MPAGTTPPKGDFIPQVLQTDLNVFRALADPLRGFCCGLQATVGGLLDQSVERTHHLAHLPA
jgi:hypothetical protein